MKEPRMVKQRRNSLRRSLAAAGFVLALTLLVTAVTCEVGFSLLERAQARRTYHHGPGGHWVPDDRWGWKPATGTFEGGTAEFEVEGHINNLFMNDADFDLAMEEDRVRIMALGDSHTYAVGVSMEQTWVKILEGWLNHAAGGVVARTCNAAAPGYSLHQYLMRLIDQGPIIRPRHVIVGLSYATDFYDLLPPDRGGWIYGGDMARHYFDFDAGGALVERVWRPEARRQSERESPNGQRLEAQTLRQNLDRSATFRFLRRSRLALFIGSKLRFGGQSLWPNMDVVLEREVSPRHEYQVRLAFALLAKIRDESERLGADLIVVGIPYLPQVYDDVWNVTFGGDQRFSRTAAIERVANFCSKNGIRYIDTLESFRDRVKREGRWMHHRKDAHPTAEGQEVIADTIVAAGVIDLSR